MPLKLIRMLGLGAFGVVFALIGLAAIIVWITLPAPTTGIDWTLAIVTWISVAVVVAALAAAHIVLGRQLLWMSKGAVRPV